MHAKRIILLLLASLYYYTLQSQSEAGADTTDAYSLRLYYSGQWKELLRYGKYTLANSNTDLPLLRMRTGYAAFVLGNHSESLKLYEQTYVNDHQNYFALYYTYLNNVYLNNTTAARFYAAKMPVETRNSEKLKRFRVSSANLAYSYKIPQTNTRGIIQYGSLGVNVQLGYRLELQQVAGFFNQNINETKFAGVINNRNIAIAQREYYAKLIFAVTGRWSLMGGGHYVNTPFNNYVYQNKIGFGGIKYTRPYIHFQLMAHAGLISDVAYKQLDASVTTYPLGNTKLYTITRAAYSTKLIFAQIVGYRIIKNIWLEGNTTLGQYTVLLDNDDLYLYNDIDTKIFKAGGSLYFFNG